MFRFDYPFLLTVVRGNTNQRDYNGDVTFPPRGGLDRRPLGMKAEWYYRRGAKVSGPFSQAEVRYLFQIGTVGRRTAVRHGMSGSWQPAENFAELKLTAKPTSAKSLESAPKDSVDPRGVMQHAAADGSATRKLISDAVVHLSKLGISTNVFAIGAVQLCLRLSQR